MAKPNTRLILGTLAGVAAGCAAGIAALLYFNRESIIVAFAAGLPVGLAIRLAATKAAPPVLACVGGGVAFVAALAIAVPMRAQKAIDAGIEDRLGQSEFRDWREVAEAYGEFAGKDAARFMADEGFGTNASEANEVTADEKSRFEQYTAPILRWMNESSPEHAAWKTRVEPVLRAYVERELGWVQIMLHKRDWFDTLSNLLAALIVALAVAVGRFGEKQPTFDDV